MGNFEKLVVLTVLFLVAIVLGVSLNSPRGSDDNGPVGDAYGRGDEDAGAPAAVGDEDPRCARNALVRG